MIIPIILRVIPRTDLVELECINCGEVFWSPEPQTCCSGRDCGCMGMPIDPIVCSRKCFQEAYPHTKIDYKKEEKRIQQEYISKITK